MPDLLVAEELQTFLVAQGIGTLPTAASADPQALPTVWLDPRDGAPQPRQRSDGQYLEPATITIRETVNASEWELEPWVEETFVDVVIRARSNRTGKLLHRQIRDLLAPRGELGGRKDWDMNDLHVEQSQVWRGDQPVSQDPVSYDRIASFRFLARRTALAGTP